MKKSQPPRFILHLLKGFCKPEYHADIEGDLLEYYDRRVATVGRTRAGFLLLKDVLLLFRPGIIRSASSSPSINNTAMVRSYFKMGWRNLRKSKMYSTLNVTGLTFGIVCFLLIGLYVFDELTFDHQHTHADRIYRVVEHKTVNGEATIVAAAGYKLAEEAKHTISEVENATRVQRAGRANLVDPEKPVPVQETVTIADEQFLQIFDFQLIAGDRKTALKEPNSIIINEDLAMRIFNSVDVLNRNLAFSHLRTPLKITAVLKNHPLNSSFTFNSVMSESTYYGEEFFKQTMESDWASGEFSVYTLLRTQSDADSVSRKLTRMVLANSPVQAGTQLFYTLQPLTDMHLHSEGIVDGARNSNVESIAQGNPVYITVFSFTALFVLLIAGINYTNLTTARATSRIKEIGVRKTIGAVRGNLIGQFLIESLITTAIAFVLAVIIVGLLLPAFNDFVNKKFSLFTTVGFQFWIVAVALVLIIGLLSGGYAAILLSRFNPISLLKGMKIGRGGDLSVRKVLVILQFAVSTVMIIATMVLLLQVRYLTHTDLGFNKELMLVIDVNVQKARTNFEWVKNEMAKIPAVSQVSVTSRVPGEWKTFRRIKFRKEGGTGDPQIAYMIGADKEFLPTYAITLRKGRNFSEAGDSSAVLVNETAARMLGITESYEQLIEIPEVAGDASFVPLNSENEPFKPRVVGIVKDFHFQSLREKIQPLVIAYHNNPLQPIDYYSVKISPTDIPATLEKLKAIMVANDEREPFEYHFLDDQLALFYIEDERRQTLLGWVALASVFIACLGLFGLATYSAEQRLKEIGMRKVLGATVFSLISLLSKDFVKLVLIANCFAFPIAWWGTRRWLQEYAYHIEVEWWVFVVAAILATGIALLTVSYQAVRAAVVSPVKVLKSE